MRSILTPFVSAFWTLLFGLLAIVAAAHAFGGAPEPLARFGNQLRAAGQDANPAIDAGWALGFGVVAVLFLWALLTTLFERDPADAREVAALAFAGGIAATIGLLIHGAATGAGSIAGATLQLVGLLVSFGAVETGGSRALQAGEPASPSRAGRLAGTEPLHSALLIRLADWRNERGEH